MQMLIPILSVIPGRQTLYGVTDSFKFKTVAGVVGIGGVFVIKTLKKRVSGFSLGSFLHWYFGIMPSRPFSWPPSHKRFWLP